MSSRLCWLCVGSVILSAPGEIHWGNRAQSVCCTSGVHQPVLWLENKNSCNQVLYLHSGVGADWCGSLAGPYCLGLSGWIVHAVHLSGLEPRQKIFPRAWTASSVRSQTEIQLLCADQTDHYLIVVWRFQDEVSWWCWQTRSLLRNLHYKRVFSASMILMHRGSVCLEGVGIRLSRHRFCLHRIDYVCFRKCLPRRFAKVILIGSWKMSSACEAKMTCNFSYLVKF